MKSFYFFLVGCLLFFAGNAQHFHSVRPAVKLQTVSLLAPGPDTIQTKQLNVGALTLFHLALRQRHHSWLKEKEPVERGSAFLPLKDLRLNSPYGYRNHPVTGKYAFHGGVDLAARADTVFSVLHGIVKESGKSAGLGNYVTVSHGKISSTYGHLSRRFVRPGEAVAAGSPVGITGSTGRVTGEHLHFVIRRQGKAINPLRFLHQVVNMDLPALISYTK